MNYISRVTNINRTVINNTITNNSTNITKINNVLPPQQVVTRNADLRQIIPPALLQGQPLPASKPTTNVRQARANLGKPNILQPRRSAAADGPDSQGARSRWGLARAFPGAGLPAKAPMPLTPQAAAGAEATAETADCPDPTAAHQAGSGPACGAGRTSREG